VEIKCQLDVTQVFIEDLIACPNKKNQFWTVGFYVPGVLLEAGFQVGLV